MNHFRTRAVHAGHGVDPATGAHITPIFQTSTFSYGSFDRGARIFAGEEPGYIYSRIGNPTVRALEQKLANLESGEDAIAFSSGMAATSAFVFTWLKPGDEVVYLGPLYGGTEGLFLDVLTRFGVQVHEAMDIMELERKITTSTKLVYMETPTNPTLKITSLKAVAALAHAVGALAVADNTFSTPYLTRPLEHGFDAVIHSMTKYLGGHGDALGGALIGSGELIGAVRMEGLRHLGGCLGPQEAYLFLRGVKTLALRMEAHCDGAERIAQHVKMLEGVKRVYYPGLSDHPNHEVAAQQMQRFGGMVSLELEGGLAAARVFLDSLTLFTQAVSLGDVESLACHPATTTHQLLTPELRAREGVTDGLVRLSVGIEDPDDLIADVTQALGRAMREVQTVQR
jgi:methionine-gamma-lyase